jgi:hypothetical protein
MGQGMGEGPGAAADALRQLATSLQDPFFRKAFAADPEAALAQAGISREAIPPDILEVLLELSPKELGALARVRKVLRAGNVPDDVTAEMV